MQPYFIVTTSEGLAYETISAAFAASGREVSPIYVSERDLDEQLLDLRTDIDCMGFQSGKVSKDLFVMDTVFPFHDHAVTLAANNIVLDKIADLQGKKVIAYTGAKELLGADFEAVVTTNPQYHELYNHRSQVKLLLKNQVQVIIADKLLIEWYARYLKQEHGDSVKLVFHDLFPPGRLRFACRQPELLQDFIQGLDEIRRNGKLDKILARYITPT